MPVRLPRGVPGLLVCGLSACALSAQPGRDNVLVVIADDLGVDAVGAYGYPTAPPTPNIDALAAAGVRFTEAWANPVCSPTRACMHTGRHALRTFVGTWIPQRGGGVLKPEEITLPELLDLGGSGHAHALIGKWHLDEQRHTGMRGPNVAGWSHFAGLLTGSVGSYYSWQRTVNGITLNSTVYATTQIVDDALWWIGRQQGPWVCFVSFNAPHQPLHAPPAHLHNQPLEGKTVAGDPVAFYRAMVEAMDTEIGRLLQGLGPARARTNVVFTSDNGAPPVAAVPPFVPSRVKGTPYQGGIHVPLIVAGPAVQSPGRTSAALACSVDLFTTVAELAGLDVAATMPPWRPLDAVSLVPSLADPAHPGMRETAYAERFRGENWSAVHQDGFAAIRDRCYKLIRRYAPAGSAALMAREELYDLQADPLETRDLLLGRLTAQQVLRYQGLRAELARLRSPQGILTDFGTAACAGSNGAPSVHGAGTPAVGGSYAVELRSGARGAAATLLTGASATAWGATPLPFDLSLLGAGPGCVLHVSGEVALAAVTDGTGAASITVAVPAASALVGNTLFHSWLIADPAAPANALGITSSNALAAILGT